MVSFVVNSTSSIGTSSSKERVVPTRGLLLLLVVILPLLFEVALAVAVVVVVVVTAVPAEELLHVVGVRLSE
jgi:hypothetical protein